MKDVQSEKDLRNIPLKHVGIKGLRWPIELRDKARGTQHSVAEVTLAVDLPHDMRGTHMSRLWSVCALSALWASLMWRLFWTS